MIGDQKFALFASVAIVPFDGHNTHSGILYRAGEVSCISVSEDEQNDTTAPFDMNTATMMPAQITADTAAEAVANLGASVESMIERIVAWQESKASARVEEIDDTSTCDENIIDINTHSDTPTPTASEQAAE